jgi:hypothetical protein
MCHLNRKRMKTLRPAHAVALLLATVTTWFVVAADAGSDRASRIPLNDFPRERIAVESGSIRRHLFEAWRADTYGAREQGLMFVEDREMRPDQAMIFVYDPPQRVAMWMKNTLLSLDMLFVDSRGCIVTIRERAQPGSLATIHSGVPVVLVVELRAGTVEQLAIKTGDRVVRIDAGWPRATTICR